MNSIGNFSVSDSPSFLNSQQNNLNPQFIPQSPIIFKMIIMDIVLEPSLINEEIISQYREKYNPINLSLIKMAPRNSVIAKQIIIGNNSQVSQDISYILAPFFPSHLSLPCKVGEVVWTLFDNSNPSQNFLYWICKITTDNLIDDVNHTHFPRQFDYGNKFLSLEDEKNKKEIKYNFNDSITTKDIESTENDIETINDIGSSKFLINKKNAEKNAFEDIFTESDGSKLITYEAIPRFKKRPGDIALEGSNNTLIVLGTDRSGSYAEIQNNKLNLSQNESSNSKGSIDIVAGRKVPNSLKITNSINKEELKKMPFNTMNAYTGKINNEGDPDFINDKSRIYISQKTNADNKLSRTNNGQLNTSTGILKYNSELGISDVTVENGCVIVKSDSIRMVARKDFQILLKGDENSESDNDDDSKYCSITLKSNGEIILKPSQTAVIKIGGEDANKAILCTENAFASNGNVSASPIITNGGQAIGSSGGINGVFASKILIK